MQSHYTTAAPYADQTLQPCLSSGNIPMGMALSKLTTMIEQLRKLHPPKHNGRESRPFS